MAQHQKHAKPFDPDVFPKHLASENDKLLQKLPEEMRTSISLLPHSEKDFPFITKLLIASGGLPASYFHDETIANAISKLASHFDTCRQVLYIFKTALGYKPNLFTVSNPALKAAIGSFKGWHLKPIATKILWLPFKNGGDPAIIHQMFKKCEHRDDIKKEIVEAFFTRQTNSKCCKWFMECIPDIQNVICRSRLIPQPWLSVCVRPSTDKMDAVWNEFGKIFAKTSIGKPLSEFEQRVLEHMPFAFGEYYFEILQKKFEDQLPIVNEELSFEIWLYRLETVRDYVKWTRVAQGADLDDDETLARVLGERFRLDRNSTAHALALFFETPFIRPFLDHVCNEGPYDTIDRVLRIAAGVLKSRGLEDKTDAFCSFIIREFNWSDEVFPFRDGYKDDYSLSLPIVRDTYFS